MSNRLIMFFVCLVGGLTGVSSDIYAPAINDIAKNLNVTSDWTQWSMAMFLAGVSLSQLFYGAYSEAYGRKYALTLGLCIMMVGSTMCMVAPDISWLIIGRFIQGAGAGVGAAIWRSIFRDGFKDEEMAQYGGYLALFFLLVLPLAPIVGSALSPISWRLIFVVLMMYNFISLGLVLFYFDETNRNCDVSRWSIKFISKTYQGFMVNKEFMGICFSIFFTYGAFFSWFIVGPVLIERQLGYPDVVFSGISFATTCSMMFLAAILNNKFMRRFGPDIMLLFGWSNIALGGIIMLVFSALFGLNLPTIVVATAFLFFGTGFIFPNLFAGAMVPYAKLAGYAASLYSFIQMLGGAFWGGFLSHMSETTSYPMGAVMLLGGVMSAMVYTFAVIYNPKRHRLYDEEGN